jgi:hypothetical protein
MKIAYFDCFSGISGDMILGALIDAGLELKELETGLNGLSVRGFRLRAEKTSRRGITGTKVTVEIDESHTERHLKDIAGIVDRSDLDEDIKSLGKRIFTDLAVTEARIHGKSVNDVHFHEISAVDSIVDVIGAIVGLKKLGVKTVYASKINVGTGFVECGHGTLPVPAPATLDLLKGIPIYSTGILAELATPTGIAIIKNVAKGFGVMPDMKVEAIGYGAGFRDIDAPNLLRVYIGESCENGYEKDTALLIEANIDNMNPEIFGYVSEKLLNQGALDVFMTPIYMKKNRPGTLLSVLTTAGSLQEMLSMVFSETTTLGVRIHSVQRTKLVRETISIKTRLGEIRVKVGRIGREIKNIAAEYEDCRQIADREGMPLKDVYQEAEATARDVLRRDN